MRGGLGWIGMVILAVAAGAGAWSALDVALGGPGLVARWGLHLPSISLQREPAAPSIQRPMGSGGSGGGTGGVARMARRIAVYEANGLLIFFYALIDHAAAAAAAAMASAVALLEARRGVPIPQRAFTGVALAASIAASLMVPPPVPTITALMWALIPPALLLDPASEGLGWRAKSGILLYAGAAILYAAYARMTAGIPPEAWAALAGGVEEARAVMAQSRSYVSTLANIALWFVLPAAYVSMIAQALLAHPLPEAPFRTIAERVRILRTRGVE